MTCGLPTAIMKRREFITLLGGSAAWPLAARAQQGERMRRVGLLMNTTSEESEAQSHVAAFQQGMQENGWSVGRNLRVDLRWGAVTLTSRAATRRSWRRFHRTRWWRLAALQYPRYRGQATRYRSYSRSRSIRSVPGSWPAWPSPEATPQALRSSNTA